MAVRHGVRQDAIRCAGDVRDKISHWGEEFPRTIIVSGSSRSSPEVMGFQ
jgi:hypothetical protein